MKALQIFIFGFMIYALSRTKPKDLSNEFTGGDTGNGGNTGGNTGGGGSSPRGYTFQYNQPSNQSNLYLVHLVSHSRVCTPVSSTALNAISLLEYWLKDSANNTVVYVKDEIGGHHPNFFDAGQMSGATNELRAKIQTLKTSFVSNPPFYTYEDRTNNHRDFFNKNLPAGTYKWIVKNNGNVVMNLFAGYAYSETEEVQVNNHVLGAGETVEFNLNIAPCQSTEHPNSPFKINANNNQ